jgi:hypothetical protein
MAVEYLGSGEDDGCVHGRSAADKIAFYNATPVVQPAATAQSAITAGATTTSTIALLIEIRTALVNLGIIKGSA